jgi:hypothetical protein
VLTPELAQVDLDAHLEEQQDRADFGEQADLRSIGDVAGGKGRDDQSDGEVADDRRECQAAGDPACGGRSQEDRADLEDGDRGVLHAAMVGRVEQRAAATCEVPVRSAAASEGRWQRAICHGWAMLGWLRRFVLYRVLGGRVLLALAVLTWIRGFLAGRRAARKDLSERKGTYQPSQGESQIVQREPR